MTIDLLPTILEGTHIRLVPMSMDHCDQLWEAGLDEELWRLTTVVIKGRDDMRRYIQEALKAQDKGMALPFVTVEKKTNKLVGSTRYGNIDESHRRVEIGWTWVAREWQRTVVNTEAKYLMLRHAFETMHCIRVEFKTDSLNEASRNALKRIGAKEEGVFRNHMITPGGRIRHSVYFSIIDSEWPDVKLQLERRLARGTGFAPNTGQT
jgi:RimJ/RimL family protein N-acetyltransferase